MSPARREPSGRSIVIKAVTQFAVSGAVVAVVVGSALTISSRRTGEREAIVDARATTEVRAHGFVEPILEDSLVTLDDSAIAAVDSVVRARVLDDQLVRVKIWSRDGTIIYSDESRLIGHRYELGADEIATIDDGLVEAEVSDLSKPENHFERTQGKLLEVYLPVRLPNGQYLMFEAYFLYDSVVANGSRLWRSFVPISLGALAALQLVQIPLAWSLARRLRVRQLERESLLQRALDASDTERRRIAADLHDGVVQDLAGVAFSLGGAARHSGMPDEAVALLDRSTDDVQESIRALRSLLIEIYPPNLAQAGLKAALEDLANHLRVRGVDVTIDFPSGLVLPDRVAAMFFRVAQEALRNIVKHAQVGMASVKVNVDEDGHLAVLEVADAGIGFDVALTGRSDREGHFGLRSLEQVVNDADGVLSISSEIGRGTRIRVEVPIT